MNDYIQLLRRNPSFFRLWLAQAVSLLGDWFTTIALSTLVSRYTNGSGLAVSALILARFVPPLFVGPLAGVVVDRLNRKNLLIFSDLVRTLIVLMFLFVTGPHTLWLIYLLSILQFSLSALFDPCRQAMLPAVVGRDELVQANTLGSVTWSVMLSVGAVVGGAVAALVGTQLALLFDSATFLVSALLIVSIRMVPVTAIHTALPTIPTTRQVNLGRMIRNGLSGLREGLRYIAAHPATAAVLLVKFGGNIGNLDLIMVIYATQLFVIGENGTGSLGILYSAFGVGAVLGPILLNRYNNNTVHRMRRLITVAYVFVSLGWVLFGTAPTLLLASLALIVRAMGSSIYWTYSSAIIQKTVPDDFLGRVFSIDQLGFQLATTLSAIVTGWVIDRFGTMRGFDLNMMLGSLQGALVTTHASEANIRTVVLVSAIISLIPLISWILLLPYTERHDPAI